MKAMAIASGLVAISTVQTVACGSPLLWAMLFAQVPAAKQVYDADIAARRTGDLQPRVFDAPSGTEYHGWSMHWIEDVAQELAGQAFSEIPADEPFTILLADAVVAMQFLPEEEVRVISAGGLGQVDEFDAITTVNALESGLHHGIGREKMIELGVLLPVTDGTVHHLTGLF